jgi:hypothetical protein
MTSLAERLLDLTIEYAASKDSRLGVYSDIGTPEGREPEVIAEEYAGALRELLADP